MNIEDSVVDFIQDTAFSDLSSEAIKTAKLSLIDIIGVTLAGSRDSEIQTLESVVRGWGGTQQCSVLGYTDKLSAPMAALINGASSRVLDFDDVVDPLGTHPSVGIFAPLLAISQLKSNPPSGQEFLTAVVLGQELSIRLARARRETLLESGRYDLSKTIASTASAGKLFGLNKQQLHHALGIAYTSSLGETQCMIDGASSVFYQQGLVASNTVKSVILASNGLTGANNFLTGRWGYYSAFEPGSDLPTITDNLGKEFINTRSIAFKPYPTCRPNVSAASLAVDLTRDKALKASDIERIEVTTNQQIYDLVCAPEDQKQTPSTVVDARFSMAYNIAASLVTKGLFINDFNSRAIKRQDVLSISKKVKCNSSPECDDPKLGTHGIIKISIILTNGDKLSGTISSPKGNPENPLTEEEIHEKFIRCLQYTENDQLIKNTHNILDAIYELDTDSCNTTHLINLFTTNNEHPTL